MNAITKANQIKRRLSYILLLVFLCTTLLTCFITYTPVVMAADTTSNNVDPLLDPNFISQHGGNTVTINPINGKSPYEAFGAVFGDNPVEGVTKQVRALIPTAGRHVENFFDTELNREVFKVETHDGFCDDGCYKHNALYDPTTGTWSGGNTDRQRIEIRPDSDEYKKGDTGEITKYIGLENDITAYNWKLKIDKDLPKPDGFFHIFQYKSYNSTGAAIRDAAKYPLHSPVKNPDDFQSDEDGNPILTLTVTGSDLLFRHAAIGTESGMNELAKASLSKIKGKWLDVSIKILNSECGWVTMTMKDAITGEIYMQYDDPDSILDMWRRPEVKYNGQTFEGPYPAVPDMHNRPKWGIYRKAEKNSTATKGAKIYLADVTLTKSATGEYASAANLAYGKKAYNIAGSAGETTNGLQKFNAVPSRLTDGVQIDPVIYPTTGLTVTEDVYSKIFGILSWMGTESSKKGNVVIDLGKIMDFNQLKIFAKSTRLKYVDVSTSVYSSTYTQADIDKVAFTRVGDMAADGSAHTYFNSNNAADDTKDAAPYVIDLDKTYSTRYIKLFFENGGGSANATTMSGPPRITEVEVYNKPQTPKNIKIDYTNGSEATVSWDASAASYYTIYDAGTVLADKVTANSYTLTNLDPGAQYSISVKAALMDPYSFKSMLSAKSSAVNFTTSGNPIIPNPPAAVNVTAASDTSITAIWDAVSDAQSYRVVLVTDACERTIKDEWTDTSYTIGDLAPGTEYRVKIYSIRKGTVSAAGTEGRVTTTGDNNSSENLLFNKEVQYSRVWSDNTASFGGKKALDNDVADGSRWVALKGSATAWLMVDIGEVTPVNVLEYYSFQNKLKKISFYYATEGEAFTDPNSDKWVKILTDDRAADGRYGNPSITKTEESKYLSVPVNARFIKFVVDSVDGDINVNEVKAFYRKAATPEANPKGGVVAAGTKVSLATSTVAGSVYYTIDGSIPTVASAVYYAAPITIDKAMIIKAITVMEGMDNSDIMSESYTLVQSSSGGYVPPIIAPPSDVIKAPTPVADTENGAYKTTIDKKSLEDAFASIKDSTGAKKVSIEVPKVDGAKAYTSVIPGEFVTAKAATRKIEIKTEIATVTVPDNMLNTTSLAAASQVGVKVAAVDTASLPADIQKKVANRPVINLNVTVDGKVLEFNNPNAPVTVKIPYKATAAELANSEHIVVWYIDGAGKIVPVSNGRYDAATATVTFATTHFSQYAVAYVEKTFDDIANYDWAKKSIEVLASKGIINGKSEKAFDPGAEITRADYTVLLIKTLGLTAKVEASFADVNPADYYYQELGIAKALGIAVGQGDNRFNPSGEISRQDMMVLTAKAMAYANKLTAAGSLSDLKGYTDNASISAYAVESVAKLVKEGLIQGSGNSINPLGNATRAEIAVLMYRIYNK